MSMPIPVSDYPDFLNKEYTCYIKSHCEAPDFEMTVEAINKREAVHKILEHLNKFEYWSYRDVCKNVYEN